jgi:hypothetical protein
LAFPMGETQRSCRVYFYRAVKAIFTVPKYSTSVEDALIYWSQPEGNAASHESVRHCCLMVTLQQWSSWGAPRPCNAALVVGSAVAHAATSLQTVYYGKTLHKCDNSKLQNKEDRMCYEFEKCFVLIVEL